MSSSSSSPTLEEHLNRKTFVMGLQLWTVIGIAVGISIFTVLLVMVACLSLRHRHQRHRSASKHRWGSSLPLTQIPAISKEIKEVSDNRYTFFLLHCSTLALTSTLLSRYVYMHTIAAAKLQNK